MLVIIQVQKEQSNNTPLKDTRIEHECFTDIYLKERSKNTSLKDTRTDHEYFIEMNLTVNIEEITIK